MPVSLSVSEDQVFSFGGPFDLPSWHQVLLYSDVLLFHASFFFSAADLFIFLIYDAAQIFGEEVNPLKF
jgi:hypothetical protein